MSSYLATHVHLGTPFLPVPCVCSSGMIDSQDERKRQANEAYVERARLELEMLESQNAGLRLVAEEKERYRQRQA